MHNLISLLERLMNTFIVVAYLDGLQVPEVACHAKLDDGLDHHEAIQIWWKLIQPSGDGRNGDGVSSQAHSRHEDVEHAAFEQLDHEFLLGLVLFPVGADHVNDVLGIGQGASCGYAEASDGNFTELGDPVF